MFGAQKRMEPLVAEGRQAVAAAQDALTTLVAVGVAVLLVSLATLAAVLLRD